MEKHTVVGLLLTILFTISCLGTTVQAQSLYQDRVARSVGDVLMVILQEDISGSTSADAENNSMAGAGGGGSVSGNFLPFQPTFGSDVEVNYEADERVSTAQGQLLEGRMSVEVVDINEGGNLIIEGKRSTEINGELHEMNLSGVVRPVDINGNNQILSYQIANAVIDYEKEGGPQRVMKKEGFIKRVVLTGIGAALGAAIIYKAVK